MAMADNKDVVGARISLDTSKMIPAFKAIDQGVKGNAETFKVLNQEITVTTKNYTALATASNKLALTSEERRKKIMAESEALVKQRTAQTELIQTKKSQMEQANKLVDAKMAAQEAIIRKRYDAIEQQEREHQKRMETLQNKATASALKLTTGSSSSTGTDSTRERVLMQEQVIRQKIAQLAERESQQSQKYAANYEKFWLNALQARERKETQVREKALQEEQRIRRSLTQTQTQINGITSTAAQFAMTGTLYYAFTRGATEAISLLKDFEYELVNVQRVMGESADVGYVKDSMISSAKEYGYALREVASVYTLIAQNGFDEKQTEQLARTALMAKNVEQSFQSASQAQELMTGAILNYGMAAEDSEKLLDKLNEVSNNFPTTSKKLLEGINRVGATAKNAGVDIDELIGYLTTLNQAGFSGSVAGNAIKSFISFSSRPIAVDKLEKYVGVMKQANGDMMKFPELLSKIAAQWDNLSDVERNEITQAIARGDQASRFIALMNNYSKVMDVAKVSEESFGSAQRENTLTMSTLTKQSEQLRASWDEMIVSIGDSGLLGGLKLIVGQATILLDGFNHLPSPIKNTVTAILLLGGAISVLNAGTRILTGQTLVSLATGVAGAAKAMLGMKVATDAANVSQKAFIATPIGAALAGLAVVIGAATTAWAYYKGTQSQVSDETMQQNRKTAELVARYDELKSIVDDNTKSDKEVSAAKSELANVMDRLSATMPGLVSQWDELGNAKELDIQKIEEWKTRYSESIKIVEQANLDAATKRKAELEQEIAYTDLAIKNASESDLSLVDKVLGKTAQTLREMWGNEMISLGTELSQEEQKILASKSAIDALNGVTEASVAANSRLATAAADSADSMENYSDSTDAASSSTEELSDEVKSLIKAQEEWASTVKGNSQTVSELNGVLDELAKGQSLNASNATDLINKYPELASAIYKTADGWAFETDAVNNLRKMKIQKAIDDLNSEKSSAFNTKVATDERLSAYQIEADAIKSLAQLKAQLNGSKAITGDNVTQTGDDLKYFKSQFREAGIAQAAAEAEIQSIIDDYDTAAKVYDDKIAALSSMYQDPSFGVSSSKNSKDKSGSKDKSKSSNAEKAEKAAKEAAAARKEAYDEEMDNFQYVAERQGWSIEQQISGYERLKNRHKQYLAEDKDASKEWTRDIQALNDSRYNEDVSILEKKIEKMRQANLQEIEMVKTSLNFYNKELSKSYLTTEQKAEAQKQVFDLAVKYNELRYQNSQTWIDKEATKMEMAGKSKINIITMELQAYERMAKDKNRTAEQSFALEKLIYEQKKSLLEQQYSDFQKDLNHRKAMGQTTTESELQDWLKIQAIYRVGTDQRMEADEQVYALRQKLIEDETKAVETLAKNYKTSIEASKNTAIKAIEEERDAYVAAKDAEIQAIDDLLSKQQELNEDQDYESALSEKQARLALLASAVGPDGIAERKQVQKDIEKLQLDHERTLAKRSLEEQKQALQDEKDAKKEAYDKDIEATKTHYDELLQALEDFSSDTANRAELMKNIQVLKESEKNAEILAQLDQFIADYQSKMSSITALTPTVSGSTASLSVVGTSKKDLDLIEYNANKDAWTAAQSSGNTTEAAKLTARNEELRKLYGITKDTGKLQSFHTGGEVKGDFKGQEVIVKAKVGERFYTEQQHDNLFKMPEFKMPSINYSLPQFSMPAASGSSNPQHTSTTSVTFSGDTYIEDSSTARVYWNERDNFVRRAQSRTGVK
ncbi:phage tail tape measure protein [Paenibacillus odorifer]|uniref:Phage tail tape measure protein n=2 Tax=Paenibacillus TaxID=44249 RepID=A0AB36J3W6_9BACL|nr:phage tail tape measure protein [Paenibacillus odorifer]